MLRRHVTYCLLTCITWSGLAVAALAQTPGAAPASERATIVAPVLESQTVIVGRLDVKSFPFDELKDQVVSYLKEMITQPEDQQQMDAAANQLKMLREAFLAAGGEEIVVVYSTLDFPRPPFFVITASKPDGVESLETFLKGMARGGNPHAMEVRRSADHRLLVGVPAVLDRVQALEAQPRPDFVAALQAASDQPFQLIIAPGPDQHRVLKETFPQLPPPWQFVTGEAISNGMQWAALTIDTAPALQANVLIQSASESAAEQLKQLITKSLQQLAQLPPIQQAIPDAAQVVNVLQPEVKGNQVKIHLTADANTLQLVLKPVTDAIAAARQAAQRSQSSNNLKQLALAMHNYYDVHKKFPPAASYDAAGKPLLSWRVHLLPYLEQKVLYDEFKLDEPWDSEHNKKLASIVVPTFQDPLAHVKPGMTNYLVPIGEGTVFGGKETLTMKEIVDGTSNTLMIVAATPERAVPWTKPEDLPVTQADPKKGLVDAQHPWFLTAFCDGSVRVIAASIDNGVLWQLFNAQDRTPIDPEKIR